MKESPSEAVMKLMETKSFDSLAPQEKQIVLSEMSQMEYEAYNSLIIQSQSLSLPHLTPDPAIRDAIKKRLGNRLVSDSSFLEKISQARMPIWAAAVFTLVGCGLVQLLQGNKTKEMAGPALTPSPITLTQIDTVYKQVVDTVYKEIAVDPIIITKEIIKEVFIEKSMPIAASKPNALMPPSITENKAAYYSDYETKDLVKSAAGKSVGTETELMEFLNQNEESSNNFILDIE